MKKLILITIVVLIAHIVNAQGTKTINYHGGCAVQIVSDGTNVFVVYRSGEVLLSTNNGKKWTVVINPPVLYGGVTSLAISGKNIFSGTNNGVFLSTNNGSTWTGVNNGLIVPLKKDTFTLATIVYALAINGATIFAGTNRGLFLSSNNGSTWTEVNNGFKAFPNIKDNPTIVSLAVSDSNIFAVTGVGLLLSTNNGNSWTSINNGLPYFYSTSLAISGKNIFAGTSDGVYLSTNNGSSWTAVNSGLTRTQVYSLAISEKNIFAGTNHGLFLSTNNGTSWTKVNKGFLIGTQVLSLAISGATIFAGTEGDGVFLSTNNGSSWTSGRLLHNCVISLANGVTNIFAGSHLYRPNGNGIWGNQKSIGFLPEINFLPNYSLGLSISKATFKCQDIACVGFGANLGYSYSLMDKLSIPNASIWCNASAFFIGLYGGIKTLYYTNGRAGNFGIRPEIGFGFLNLNIFYGYNFFIYPGIENVPRNTLTISFYYPFFPWKKKHC